MYVWQSMMCATADIILCRMQWQWWGTQLGATLFQSPLGLCPESKLPHTCTAAQNCLGCKLMLLSTVAILVSTALMLSIVGQQQLSASSHRGVVHVHVTQKPFGLWSVRQRTAAVWVSIVLVWQSFPSSEGLCQDIMTFSTSCNTFGAG